MELKFNKERTELCEDIRINRTFMELKWEFPKAAQA